MSPLAAVFFVIGLVLLTGGAELLVRGASRIASAFGIPPLVVGLTVVAFGTSAPEIAVSVRAAMAGNADVSVGNVVGSNIFNVLVILGLSALIAPLAVQRQLVRFDVPVLIVVSSLPLLLGLDRLLGFGDGVLLLALGVTYTSVLAVVGLRNRTGSKDLAARGTAEYTEWAEKRDLPTTLRNLGFVVMGLAGLTFGADLLVDGATTIARAFGISELVIGLTLVAAGTSLPEVATSLVASIRGERDLAIGNVVGSNIFNVLIVLGVAAVVSGDGVAISPGVLALDFPFMLAVAVVCLPIFFTRWQITRIEGAAFLIFYGFYIVYLGLHASDHPFQDEYMAIIVGFVLPLTLAVASAGWIRFWRSER